MTTRVELPRRIADKFKNAAKAKGTYPREEFAILIGYRSEPTVWTVTDLYFPPERLHTSTPYSIMIDHSWHIAAMQTVKKLDLTVIGDIHSHCYDFSRSSEVFRDSSPSETDWSRAEPENGCLPGKNMVHGICSVVKTKRGKRSYIRFWPQIPKIRTVYT